MESDETKGQVLAAIGKLRGAFLSLNEYRKRLEEAKDMLRLLDWDSNSEHLSNAFNQSLLAGSMIDSDISIIMGARDELKFYLEQL